MDIATGTGQIFFDYIDYFSGVRVAQDISKKQLGVA